jgi:hypothetical protein
LLPKLLRLWLGKAPKLDDSYVFDSGVGPPELGLEVSDLE